MNKWTASKKIGKLSLVFGKDLGSPVSLYYKDKTPFAFMGKIYQVDIEVR